MKFRRPLFIALIGCLAVAGCRSAAEKAATAEAQAWLAMVDAGNHAQSWNAAAPYLQRVATEGTWEASMNRMRVPLGNVVSRKVASAKEAKTDPGDPCVIVTFETAFEHKQSAVETVTLLPEKDGHWKVAGYFIT